MFGRIELKQKPQKIENPTVLELNKYENSVGIRMDGHKYVGKLAIDEDGNLRIFLNKRPLKVEEYIEVKKPKGYTSTKRQSIKLGKKNEGLVVTIRK